MFGMGMPEIILILAIALIVIGPKKLPDLAKSLGRALGEFKHATKEFKSAIDIDADVSSIGKPFDDLSDTVKKNLSSSTKKEDASSDEKAEAKEPKTDEDKPLEADADFTGNVAGDAPQAEEADAQTAAAAPKADKTAAKQAAEA